MQLDLKGTPLKIVFLNVLNINFVLGIEFYKGYRPLIYCKL
jgi:hypothetical protein